MSEPSEDEFPSVWVPNNNDNDNSSGSSSSSSVIVCSQCPSAKESRTKYFLLPLKSVPSICLPGWGRLGSQKNCHFHWELWKAFWTSGGHKEGSRKGGQASMLWKGWVSNTDGVENCTLLGILESRAPCSHFSEAAMFHCEIWNLSNGNGFFQSVTHQALDI